VLAFRILGPVELVVDGAPQALPAKPRALLTLLLLHRNQVVALDRIVEDVWEGAPPETATKAAQIYVSQLRKVVGDRLESRAPGYRLRVEPGELDAERFEELLAGAESGSAEEAVARLDEALALWHGAALAEFAGSGFARDEAARLEERRLEAIEGRVEAQLELGRHAPAIAELERSVREQPLRERPHELLMLALYRAGRQADALEVYRRLRERLDSELGLTPSPALRELETAILRQDPELAAPLRPPRAAATPTAGPVRRAQRRRLAIPISLAALAIVAGGLVAYWPREHAQSLRPFVLKLENFLVQSSDGRKQVVALVHDVRACALSPRRALARLDLVERNRQSLLDQLAALSVPDDPRALEASDLLQKAIQASIASDLAYRGWLGTARGCPRAAPPTQAADARATTAKTAFTKVFNPLALDFGATAWDPHGF
jgi:DNA-binding SARP family transcriptional activator